MVIPSPEVVYEELRLGLAAALDQLRFQPLRTCTYPAWCSPEAQEGRRIFLSLQVDSKATDPYAGGGFRLELEASTQRLPALGLNGRALFFQLLTSKELGTLLDRQNRVIRSLNAPSEEQILAYPEGPIRQQYLAYFAPQSAFDSVRCWLRYASSPDVREWTQLLAPLVQPLVHRASIYLSPDRRTLGKGTLLTAS